MTEIPKEVMEDINEQCILGFKNYRESCIWAYHLRDKEVDEWRNKWEKCCKNGSSKLQQKDKEVDEWKQLLNSATKVGQTISDQLREKEQRIKELEVAYERTVKRKDEIIAKAALIIKQLQETGNTQLTNNMIATWNFMQAKA